MAAGRAVVVAPVGVNVDIIRHRENGLLASSEDEWVEALDELARSPSLRERFASAGRATVEARFSSERSASLFADAIRVAVGRQVRAKTAEPQRRSMTQ